MDNERGAREGGGGDIGGELKGGRVRVTTLGSALVDCRSVVTACSYREPHESYYNKHVFHCHSTLLRGQEEGCAGSEGKGR